VDPEGGLYVGYWTVQTNDGGGVGRSTDGGETFTLLPGISGQAVRALAQAPSAPHVLVAGTLTGVFRTGDGGRSWRRISPEGHVDLKNVGSVAFDPGAADTIYAGTWHLPWKSFDAGASWHPVHSGMIDDSDVFTLTVDELDAHASLQADSSSPAHVEMAAPTGESDAPPTLAQNVETLANVPAIFTNGADWFRSVGTGQSPGTIVCTVSGRVRHAGVAEVELGTPLGEIIELIGGGPEEGHELTAVMFGVSSALVPAKLFDTPATYEDLLALGSGLGAASLIVYDDTSDLTAVAAGVARFLAVESCGQCRPCKQDGLELADLLAELTRSQADASARDRIDDLLVTVFTIRWITDSAATCSVVWGSSC
jgi:hypothetical protein